MIPILHAESHFLVVNKPSGLLSQAVTGVTSLETQLIQQLKCSESHPGSPFVGLPHRLDRETSGVMLIARNQRSLKRFGQQFQSRKIGKYYLAVVALQQSLAGKSGVPQSTDLRNGVFWSDWLRKVPDEARAEIVDRLASGSRLAELEAIQIASSGQLRLLLVRLLTGRMHQIRIQAAARGLPILGDGKYGSEISFGTDRVGEAGKQERIALHALRLEFRHPRHALLVSATAPVPDFWSTLPEEIVVSAERMIRKSRCEVDSSWTLEGQV
jgi:23S rRNA-/tRNA-specific pseudouridylate synthase